MVSALSGRRRYSSSNSSGTLAGSKTLLQELRSIAIGSRRKLLGFEQEMQIGKSAMYVSVSDLQYAHRAIIFCPGNSASKKGRSCL
jgi:hypothetical protein